MKMDKNAEGEGEGGDDGDPQPRRSAAEALDEILEAFASRAAEAAPPPDLVDGIDPSSPLGRSLRDKFTELEEISRRLKSRLDSVVRDGQILLSPDGDAPDSELERDLNTDSRDEDPSPREFSMLVRSRLAEASGDGADGEDVSK